MDVAERETQESLARCIRVARGEEPADLVFVNGRVVSTFTTETLNLPVAVAEGRIVALGAVREARQVVDLAGAFLSPSFTDAHIHVESSMLTPEGFAEAVVPRGTGLVVSDPHEIANVLGLPGIEYMRRASEGLPLHIRFTVPSCVPATPLESSGATLGPADVRRAFEADPAAPALSEMMNFPGVLGTLPDALEKILAARERGLPVDGHAPGLAGSDLDAYLAAGISTDHECLTVAEAREKLRRGMYVFLREGSAARNLKDLLPAVTTGNLHRVCIVSDDLHPEDLLSEGHMDHALRRAVAAGRDPLQALRMVTLNPAAVYGLRDRGGVAPGFRADLVVLDDLREFRVREVYHAGRLVARRGEMVAPLFRQNSRAAAATVRLPGDLEERLAAFPKVGRVLAIGVEPAQITTRKETAEAGEAGAGKPLQYAAVIERHRGTGNVGLGFVKGFALKAGALASTVSHDSHNLVVVGCSPEEMTLAARVVAGMGGGLAVAKGNQVLARLPLPVAGLMSTGTVAEVAAGLRELHAAAKALGCVLPAPFMTLSFIALPVIPSLRLTDQGLVDVDRFAHVPVEVNRRRPPKRSAASGPERRKSQRLRLIAPLAAKVRTFASAQVVDVSEGGILLRIRKPLPAGAVYEMRLQLPSGEVSVRGMVRRCWLVGFETDEEGDRVRSHHAAMEFTAPAPELLGRIPTEFTLQISVEADGGEEGPPPAGGP